MYCALLGVNFKIIPPPLTPQTHFVKVRPLRTFQCLSGAKTVCINQCAQLVAADLIYLTTVYVFMCFATRNSLMPVTLTAF
jgi:hypothetical protein